MKYIYILKYINMYIMVIELVIVQSTCETLWGERIEKQNRWRLGQVPSGRVPSFLRSSLHRGGVPRVFFAGDPSVAHVEMDLVTRS